MCLEFYSGDRRAVIFFIDSAEKMLMYPGRKKSSTPRSWEYITLSVAILLVGASAYLFPRQFVTALLRQDISQPSTSPFSDRFPVSEDYQNEVRRLMESGELKPENEKQIREWSTASATDLSMPPSLLWCLFFQESRLNHLQGSSGSHPAKGLGQFLRPSFYEVNHQLDRFTPMNSQIFVRRMGQDVRPIQPVLPKKGDFSSYYQIPTAVVASATYLNSRYHQLRRNLESKGMPYNPELLWLYSAMAYNKGTRSVLSFWKEARNSGGATRVQTLLNNVDAFETAVKTDAIVERAFARIWKPPQVKRYADELRLHLRSLSRCALKPTQGIPSIREGATP